MFLHCLQSESKSNEYRLVEYFSPLDPKTIKNEGLRPSIYGFITPKNEGFGFPWHMMISPNLIFARQTKARILFWAGPGRPSAALRQTVPWNCSWHTHLFVQQKHIKHEIFTEDMSHQSYSLIPFYLSEKSDIANKMPSLWTKKPYHLDHVFFSWSREA